MRTSASDRIATGVEAVWTFFILVLALIATATEVLLIEDDG